MNSPSSLPRVTQAHMLRLSRQLTLLWHQARTAKMAYQQALDDLRPARLAAADPRHAAAAADQGDVPLPGILDATDLATLYQVQHVHRPGVPIPTIEVHRQPMFGLLPRRSVLSLDDVVPLARSIYAHLDADQEQFVLLACNTRHEAFAYKVIAAGSLDYVDVDPNLVFRHALLLGARSIVLLHNHPSGDPEPSPEDLRLTIRLVTGSDLLNCEVLDHIIIGQDGPYLSLRQHQPRLWPRGCR